MAPEIAMGHIKKLRRHDVVLDPMAGSGTVLWQAALAGHKAIGFDLDPLAVLISQVRTTRVRTELIEDISERVISKAKQMTTIEASLPWLDNDEETQEFIKYWFGRSQARQLRLIAHVLWKESMGGRLKAELDVLRLVMSRLIIRKKNGASLAWDISHSRPHKVMKSNTFDVFAEFLQTAGRITHELDLSPSLPETRIQLGDARRMPLRSRSIDAVITSPPYFNAIDYLRGHKFSLIWLGYTLSQLRAIRSESIGAERRPNNGAQQSSVFKAFGNLSALPTRNTAMILRYAVDIQSFIDEIARVLKPDGKAVIVVGNSCIKDVFVKNSEAVVEAAKSAGLKLKTKKERDLPTTSRYLPINVAPSNSLGRRMKTETVMMFQKANC